MLAEKGLAWMPTLSNDVQAVLATDKVRFQGQEVAFVVAEDRYSARDALELIDVEYDPLDPVVDVRTALDPAARGLGLARPLVAAAVDWARDRRARTVTLQVAADNAVARGVYESLGFTVTSAETRGPQNEVAMSLSVG